MRTIVSGGAALVAAVTMSGCVTGAALESDRIDRICRIAPAANAAVQSYSRNATVRERAQQLYVTISTVCDSRPIENAGAALETASEALTQLRELREATEDDE